VGGAHGERPGGRSSPAAIAARTPGSPADRQFLKRRDVPALGRFDCDGHRASAADPWTRRVVGVGRQRSAWSPTPVKATRRGWEGRKAS